MEGLTTIHTNNAISQDLPAVLYASFINYIDRSERTTQTYLTNLRQFVAWLHYASITRPTRADILAYRSYLLSEHDAIRFDAAAPEGWSYRGGRVRCSANTAAQYLRTVCQFFAWASAEGYYPNVAANIHAPKVRHDTHRKEALAPAEVLAIEESIRARVAERTTTASWRKRDPQGSAARAEEQGKRLYALYLLAVNAGLRCVELSRANVRDLQRRRGQAFLYVWGKGHSEADTKKPLASEVYDAIKDYLATRETPATPDAPLFVSTSNRSAGQRLEARTISQMLKHAMQAAGYDSDRLTAHSLRHTAGTAVQAISGDLYKTQLYMRHANPATTEIYLHNQTDDEQANLAASLFAYYHAAGGEQATNAR